MQNLASEITPKIKLPKYQIMFQSGFLIQICLYGGKLIQG